MKSKILIVGQVKDENNLQNILSQNHLYEISMKKTGNEGIQRCKTFKPDVILVNNALVDVFVTDFCIEIRKFSHCSIIIVSEQKDENDVIVGLSVGADDFVCSPYTVREIEFRIKSQVRRQRYYSDADEKRKSTKTINELGPFHLDEFHHLVLLNGQELSLTAREYLILSYFIKNPNRVITKDELFRSVWNECYVGADNVIAVHINHQRRKIEKKGSKPQYLITLKGFGYKLALKKVNTNNSAENIKLSSGF